MTVLRNDYSSAMSESAEFDIPLKTQWVILEINVKKLNSLKHRVRSQITRLKLQKSFCNLEHGVLL